MTGTLRGVWGYYLWPVEFPHKTPQQLWLWFRGQGVHICHTLFEVALQWAFLQWYAAPVLNLTDNNSTDMLIDESFKLPSQRRHLFLEEKLYFDELLYHGFQYTEHPQHEWHTYDHLLGWYSIFIICIKSPSFIRIIHIWKTRKSYVMSPVCICKCFILNIKLNVNSLLLPDGTKPLPEPMLTYHH